MFRIFRQCAPKLEFVHPPPPPSPRLAPPSLTRRSSGESPTRTPRATPSERTRRRRTAPSSSPARRRTCTPPARATSSPPSPTSGTTPRRARRRSRTGRRTGEGARRARGDPGRRSGWSARATPRSRAKVRGRFRVASSPRPRLRERSPPSAAAAAAALLPRLFGRSPPRRRGARDRAAAGSISSVRARRRELEPLKVSNPHAHAHATSSSSCAPWNAVDARAMTPTHAACRRLDAHRGRRHSSQGAAASAARARRATSWHRYQYGALLSQKAHFTRGESTRHSTKLCGISRRAGRAPVRRRCSAVRPSMMYPATIAEPAGRGRALVSARRRRRANARCRARRTAEASDRANARDVHPSRETPATKFVNRTAEAQISRPAGRATFRSPPQHPRKSTF